MAKNVLAVAHADVRQEPRKSSAEPGSLRPFFGYYGGKWRDAVRNYPPPTHSSIVEPFAGSAGYSVRYANLKVTLCEPDPILFGVWDFLIGAKPSEILKLPDIAPDSSLDDYKLVQEARWLIGFWLNRGVSSPRKTPSRWMRDKIRPGSFWGSRVKETIAAQVESIGHWRIKNCSYENCRLSAKATWFIDPPYRVAGRYYRYGAAKIDYEHLAQWAKARKGQVIVCENSGADWLPFRALADVKTTRTKRLSTEVYWTSDDDDRAS